MDLQNIHLFSKLSPNTRIEIQKCLIQRSYPPDAMLFLEGEPCSAVYFVLSGGVRIFRTGADGREQVLARMTAGMAFNTVPPLEATQINHASVRTIDETTLFCLRTEDYLRLLQTCPDFSYTILQDFAGRLSHLTDMVESLALHSVRGRLARFLLDQANRNEISQPWTQDEIAQQIGTVRDVIGRTLRAFMDEGILRRDRQKIILLDRERLEEEALS